MWSTELARDLERSYQDLKALKGHFRTTTTKDGKSLDAKSGSLMTIHMLLDHIAREILTTAKDSSTLNAQVPTVSASAADCKSRNALAPSVQASLMSYSPSADRSSLDAQVPTVNGSEQASTTKGFAQAPKAKACLPSVTTFRDRGRFTVQASTDNVASQMSLVKPMDGNSLIPEGPIARAPIPIVGHPKDLPGAEAVQNVAKGRPESRVEYPFNAMPNIVDVQSKSTSPSRKGMPLSRSNSHIVNFEDDIPAGRCTVPSGVCSYPVDADSYECSSPRNMFLGRQHSIKSVGEFVGQNVTM